MNDRNLTFIDLFAGAGGLSEGFVSNGGFIPVAHVEMNPHASMTLKTRTCYYYLRENNRLDEYRSYQRGETTRDELFERMPNGMLDTVINREISDVTTGEIFASIDEILENADIHNIDVIIGGPPCQAYSLIGRAKDPDNMRNDPRNFLYRQYIRFLNRYRPRMFIFENVPGILTANNGATFENIIREFNEAGYTVDHRILDAANFGVLQHRKRVIIIGWQADLEITYPEFRITEVQATVNDILSDLIGLERATENNVYIAEPTDYLRGSGIRTDDDILTHHTCRFHNPRDIEIYRRVITAWNEEHRRLRYTDLPEELCTHKNRNAFLDRYKVVADDIQCSHTMVAHISKDGHYFIHPDVTQCRSLSVREAARVQSFPDNYYFEGPRAAKFVQIGNAVPPLMAKGLARGIRNILENI
ncbi:DNA (cytosine-5)-methyltransferase 1 [Desulfitobacterium sp. LBE]|uniref:DNA cytosine methyltransferase n=1 Tax=Desulfitobacterium sp. LBE TaxID=884086 RepID=UPI00119987A0|nr:DNA cytosine methyltransferase [Desulfitobacterium sp. LBE]TWH59336.1 DNA (cytosine-5)-methyltransferase 1 [Desulfitobacterium sp. LBE]